MQNDIAGKVVKFTSSHGNEFKEGDIAVCIEHNKYSKKFLGLNNDNFGRIWHESNNDYIILTENDIIKNMETVRSYYKMGKILWNREVI